MTRAELINVFSSVNWNLTPGGEAKIKLNKIYDLMDEIIRDSNASNLNDNNDVSLFVYQMIMEAKQSMVRNAVDINNASYRIVTKLKESESEN